MSASVQTLRPPPETRPAGIFTHCRRRRRDRGVDVGVSCRTDDGSGGGGGGGGSSAGVAASIISSDSAAESTLYVDGDKKVAAVERCFSAEVIVLGRHKYL